jgi:transposase-like protein
MNATNTKPPPCPTPDCAAPHVVRNGTLKGRQRYHCKGCGAWYGETHGTPMYRLRTPPEEVGRVLLVVMRRGSLRAAEEITGHKYETIGRWLRLAAEHAEALTEVLVHDLELSALEVDEFW